MVLPLPHAPPYYRPGWVSPVSRTSPATGWGGDVVETSHRGTSDRGSVHTRANYTMSALVTLPLPFRPRSTPARTAVAGQLQRLEMLRGHLRTLPPPWYMRGRVFLAKCSRDLPCFGASKSSRELSHLNKRMPIRRQNRNGRLLDANTHTTSKKKT